MEPSVDGYEAIRLFGNEAIRLSVAHGPWNVNLVDFQQHLLFSLGLHITVPISAFHNHFSEDIISGISESRAWMMLDTSCSNFLCLLLKV